MQKQLSRFQEGIMKWREERLVEDGIPHETNSKIKTLETEIDRAGKSERNMLKSLVSQTKQLEQTKIQLEEAKLEIRSLQETVRSFEDTRDSRDEFARLKSDLRSAVEAEEKGKKAMDDLAIALKEVATEAKETTDKLKTMETQFLSARAEADHTMSMLKDADQRIQAAVKETKQAMAEADEAAANWQAKEDGFIVCMKSFEFEISRLQKSNDELRESYRSSREEISKLRDIMKQAVNEATVVKEALEIARNENSCLQDSMSEKERALQELKQEMECLKVSEAAAHGTVEELKNLLSATSDKAPDPEYQEADNPRVGRRKAYGSFRMPPVDPRTSGEIAKHRKFASMGDVSMRMVSGSSSCNLDGSDGFSGEEMQSARGSPARQKKKKPMLKKFGELLKRSFHK